jgi:opacity protein-like surface antigen
VPSSSRLACFAIVTAAGLASFTTPAAAQQADRSWSPAARVQAEVRYDDNPFLLTAGRKSRLDAVSTADSQSGRFRGMESATDVIPIPVLRLGIAGAGLGGRTLEIDAEVAYEANLRNAERRHAEFGFGIEQSLPRAGRLRLGADWRPSYFHKNYLADAVDQNGDGDIGPEERRYASGTSNEVDLSLGYRHRLVKATKDRPLAVTAELELGYLDRSYDAPFGGRSRSGPGAGAGVAFELRRRWMIGLDYSYESLGGDPGQEVLILNENDFGQDFNGNLSTSDDSARAVVLVDRSRAEHELGVSVQGELGKNTTIEVGYARRLRCFSSTQPFDVVNRDRRDTRNELAAELDLGLASGLHLALGARRAAQSTNRAGDPGSAGDAADYTRYVASAGVRYRF